MTKVTRASGTEEIGRKVAASKEGLEMGNEPDGERWGVSRETIGYLPFMIKSDSQLFSSKRPRNGCFRLPRRRLRYTALLGSNFSASGKIVEKCIL